MATTPFPEVTLADGTSMPLIDYLKQKFEVFEELIQDVRTQLINVHINPGRLDIILSQMNSVEGGGGGRASDAVLPAVELFAQSVVGKYLAPLPLDISPQEYLEQIVEPYEQAKANWGNTVSNLLNKLEETVDKLGMSTNDDKVGEQTVNAYVHANCANIAQQFTDKTQKDYVSNSCVKDIDVELLFVESLRQHLDFTTLNKLALQSFFRSGAEIVQNDPMKFHVVKNNTLDTKTFTTLDQTISLSQIVTSDILVHITETGNIRSFNKTGTAQQYLDATRDSAIGDIHRMYTTILRDLSVGTQLVEERDESDQEVQHRNQRRFVQTPLYRKIRLFMSDDTLPYMAQLFNKIRGNKSGMRTINELFKTGIMVDSSVEDSTSRQATHDHVQLISHALVEFSARNTSIGKLEHSIEKPTPPLFLMIEAVRHFGDGSPRSKDRIACILAGLAILKGSAIFKYEKGDVVWHTKHQKLYVVAESMIITKKELIAVRPIIAPTYKTKTRILATLKSKLKFWFSDDAPSTYEQVETAQKLGDPDEVNMFDVVLFQKFEEGKVPVFGLGPSKYNEIVAQQKAMRIDFTDKSIFGVQFGTNIQVSKEWVKQKTDTVEYKQGFLWWRIRHAQNTATALNLVSSLISLSLAFVLHVTEQVVSTQTMISGGAGDDLSQSVTLINALALIAVGWAAYYFYKTSSEEYPIKDIPYPNYLTTQVNFALLHDAHALQRLYQDELANTMSLYSESSIPPSAIWNKLREWTSPVSQKLGYAVHMLQDTQNAMYDPLRAMWHIPQSDGPAHVKVDFDKAVMYNIFCNAPSVFDTNAAILSNNPVPFITINKYMNNVNAAITTHGPKIQEQLQSMRVQIENPQEIQQAERLVERHKQHIKTFDIDNVPTTMPSIDLVSFLHWIRQGRLFIDLNPLNEYQANVKAQQHFGKTLNANPQNALGQLYKLALETLCAFLGIGAEFVSGDSGSVMQLTLNRSNAIATIQTLIELDQISREKYNGIHLIPETIDYEGLMLGAARDEHAQVKHSTIQHILQFHKSLARKRALTDFSTLYVVICRCIQHVISTCLDDVVKVEPDKYLLTHIAIQKEGETMTMFRGGGGGGGGGDEIDSQKLKEASQPMMDIFDRYFKRSPANAVETKSEQESEHIPVPELSKPALTRNPSSSFGSAIRRTGDAVKKAFEAPSMLKPLASTPGQSQAEMYMLQIHFVQSPTEPLRSQLESIRRFRQPKLAQQIDMYKMWDREENVQRSAVNWIGQPSTDQTLKKDNLGPLIDQLLVQPTIMQIDDDWRYVCPYNFSVNMFNILPAFVTFNANTFAQRLLSKLSMLDMFAYSHLWLDPVTLRPLLETYKAAQSKPLTNDMTSAELHAILNAKIMHTVPNNIPLIYRHDLRKFASTLRATPFEMHKSTLRLNIKLAEDDVNQLKQAERDSASILGPNGSQYVVGKNGKPISLTQAARALLKRTIRSAIVGSYSKIGSQPLKQFRGGATLNAFQQPQIAAQIEPLPLENFLDAELKGTANPKQYSMKLYQLFAEMLEVFPQVPAESLLYMLPYFHAGAQGQEKNRDLARKLVEPYMASLDKRQTIDQIAQIVNIPPLSTRSQLAQEVDPAIVDAPPEKLKVGPAAPSSGMQVLVQKLRAQETQVLNNPPSEKRRRLAQKRINALNKSQEVDFRLDGLKVAWVYNKLNPNGWQEVLHDWRDETTGRKVFQRTTHSAGFLGATKAYSIWEPFDEKEAERKRKARADKKAKSIINPALKPGSEMSTGPMQPPLRSRDKAYTDLSTGSANNNTNAARKLAQENAARAAALRQQQLQNRPQTYPAPSTGTAAQQRTQQGAVRIFTAQDAAGNDVFTVLPHNLIANLMILLYSALIIYAGSRGAAAYQSLHLVQEGSDRAEKLEAVYSARGASTFFFGFGFGTIVAFLASIVEFFNYWRFRYIFGLVLMAVPIIVMGSVGIASVNSENNVLSGLLNTDPGDIDVEAALEDAQNDSPSFWSSLLGTEYTSEVTEARESLAISDMLFIGLGVGVLAAGIMIGIPGSPFHTDNNELAIHRLRDNTYSGANNKFDRAQQSHIKTHWIVYPALLTLAVVGAGASSIAVGTVGGPQIKRTDATVDEDEDGDHTKLQNNVTWPEIQGSIVAIVVAIVLFGVLVLVGYLRQQHALNVAAGRGLLSKSQTAQAALNNRPHAKSFGRR